jgi:WD40 repeat protein
MWDISTSRCIKKLLNGNSGQRTCAVSPNGRLLVTGGEDSVVQVFDLSSNTISPITKLEHDGLLWSCAFSQDGSLLVTSSDDGKARIFQIEDDDTSEIKIEKATTLEHNGWVWDSAFSPDGKRILTCCDDGTIRVFRGQRGTPERVISHGYWVRGCAISTDERLIAAACNDRMARVFNAETGMLVREWEHGSWVRRCSFSPDNSILLTVGGDGQSRLINLESGEIIKQFNHEIRIRGCSFSPDGKHFATGCADGTLRIFTDNGELVSQFELHSEIWNCSFSPDGKTVLAGCNDGKVCLIDFKLKKFEEIDQLKGWVRGTAFSRCGKYFCYGYRDGGIRLWNTKEMKRLDELNLHLECWSCEFSPDSTKILSAWSDSTVCCYEVATQELLWSVPHPGWAWSCKFFPSSSRILTACDDGRLRIYELPKSDRQTPILRLTIAAAFPLPHGQSPQGYLSFPKDRLGEECDVVCEGARYPLSLLTDVLNKPKYVRLETQGKGVPNLHTKMEKQFPPVKLPKKWKVQASRNNE